MRLIDVGSHFHVFINFDITYIYNVCYILCITHCKVRDPRTIWQLYYFFLFYVLWISLMMVIKVAETCSCFVT